MRIFLPSETVIQKIAGEMFNIELGQFYYDNGIIVDKKTPYPQFNLDGVITSLRSRYGILYINDRLVKQVQDELFYISQQYEIQYDKHHFNEEFITRTSAEQFTHLCVKGFNYTNSSRLFIFSNKNLHKIMRDAPSDTRFVWIVLSLSDLLREIEECDISGSINQLISIVYDYENYFIFRDNEFLSHELTFAYTKIGKFYKDVIYMGEVNEKTMALVKNHNTSESNILTHFYEHNKNSAKFILSSILTTNIITLCAIRGGALEIIRHLGNWEIYRKALFDYIPVCEIQVPVYECTYSDVIIDDTCSFCDTPLYDDIYVCSNNLNKKVDAICNVCIHCAFISEESIYACANGYPLYSSCDVVGKLKHPRSFNEVLDLLPVDTLVRNIIRASFNSAHIENIDMHKSIHFATDSQKYIGWNGSISSFIMLHPHLVTQENYILFSANIIAT
jgi:hypothetical protein